MNNKKDYCCICDKECKTNKYYDGWNSLCSEKCLRKWNKENYEY